MGPWQIIVVLQPAHKFNSDFFIRCCIRCTIVALFNNILNNSLLFSYFCVIYLIVSCKIIYHCLEKNKKIFMIRLLGTCMARKLRLSSLNQVRLLVKMLNLILNTDKKILCNTPTPLSKCNKKFHNSCKLPTFCKLVCFRRHLSRKKTVWEINFFKLNIFLFQNFIIFKHFL